ncbi:hypothetical protein Poli38472_011669 [Pythium oligandrum]|uniref:Endothelin-converting enzyme 1 n=1 Tax=Pythium oligandrum TaxID=41045 RepID=A0A8K1C228_PYTOL|nr:hypothetical protein Poli38472_013778 [Pythium oligandrum]TMW64789.1 hypothetical protein Poli38472_011669 [Pythium oligandrum]|eukprot:TMW55016.1 hypothetical protein Poli38472_013778 [Pythium oligandrum]
MKLLNESSRLRYGTGDVQVTTPVTPVAQRPKSRAWQGVVAAILCTGALVSKEWHAPPRTAMSIADQTVQLHKKHVDAETYTSFYEQMDAFLNKSADPCVDFYEYACGGWLATHEIPSDSASIDASFYVVAEDNKKILRKIIDDKPPVIGEFYESCLNAEEVDEASVAYVAELIQSIHAVNSTVDLLAHAGELDQSLGISSFFDLQVLANPSNPDLSVLTLSQGGLTLPSREYYLEKAKRDEYTELFLAYVTDLFAVADLDKHNVSQFADNIFDTELALAQISLSNAELRDPWSTNTAYSLKQIREEFPLLSAYLSGLQKEEPLADAPVIIATPAFFEAQTEVLTSIDLLQLKNYLSFHVIDTFANLLGEYFRRAGHSFHGKVRGAGSLPTREQFCISATTTYLGEYLGEYYMRKVFDKDAKESAQSLIDQIEESMSSLLKTEAWLDNVTTLAAKDKLQQVRNYIGGPDEVTELPFKIVKDDYFGNVLSLTQLGASANIQKIGKPVDRQSWDMFASTVNAYYDPSANKIVFPAAILQPPFYSAKSFPAAANYARIGMVMGHELSHGFDDQGRNYDGKGALRKWWSPRVSEDFEGRAQCLASQYSTFPAYSADEKKILGYVNGNLTLGENIADNGGIHLSYQAYQHYKAKTGTLAGKTENDDDRVFFTSFAQQWCEKRSSAYSELLLATDPHSPGHWRVNGPAMNFDKFAETFQCAVGTPMNPEKKCVIW